MTAHMVSDFVKTREDPEFESRLHFSGESGIAASVTYELTGDAALDRPFWGVVEDTGPGKSPGPGGASWLEELRSHLSDRAFGQAMSQFGKVSTPPQVKRGDTVCANLLNVSYRLPYKRGLYMLRGDVIKLKIDRDTYETQPVGHYFTVVDNPEAIQRALSAGSIWLPTNDLSTDDIEEKRRRRRGGILAAYGQVVSVGPGRWQDGAWLQPECQPGNIVLFDATFGTLDVTVRGKKMTVVPSTQLVDVLA